MTTKHKSHAEAAHEHAHEQVELAPVAEAAPSPPPAEQIVLSAEDLEDIAALCRVAKTAGGDSAELAGRVLSRLRK